MPDTDDKLDALYRQDKDASPADLDDQIRQAARQAVAKEAGNGGTNQPVPSAQNWQHRFGWASAAVVLLTALVFINLPEEEQFQVGATSSDSEPLAESAPALAPAPVETQAPAAKISPSPTLSTAATPAPDAPTVAQLQQADTRSSSARQNRQEPAAAAFEDSTKIDMIEEIIVTGAPRKTGPPNCVAYSDTLVGRVCASSQTPGWTVHLRRDIPCKDRSLFLAQDDYPLTAPPAAMAESPTAPSVGAFVFATDDGNTWRLRCVDQTIQLDRVEETL